MRVFITGATGVFGRRLVRELADRGHKPIGLARDQEGAQAIEERGGTARRADLFDADSLVDAAGDAEVVVHAATAIPTEPKPASEDWNRNDRVRVQGGKNALEAAARINADRFLTHSVVWAFRNQDGTPIDETDSPNADRTTASAVELEEVVQEAASEHSFDASILRYGWFYGPESGQLHAMAKTLLDGELPVIGNGLLGRSGETIVSMIHTADAARAMASAIEADANGTWHVVDNEPASTDAFFGELARLLEVDAPRRLPGWVAKFFVGEDLVRFLTNSFPTSNDRFTAEVDWQPSYPTYREGLRATVETWLTTGRLVETSDGHEWSAHVRDHHCA